MSRARAAKRLAQAAALGGGGLGLIGATLYGVLTAEAEYAKRVIGPMRYYPTPGDGLFGRYPGLPITFAILGDSSAAGYGTESPEETPGVMLASGLAELAKRPVRLVDVAKTGAKSTDLAAQVDAALQAGPHVAVILIGVNDVKSKMPPSTSVRLLSAAVRRLRAGPRQEYGSQKRDGLGHDLLALLERLRPAARIRPELTSPRRASRAGARCGARGPRT